MDSNLLIEKAWALWQAGNVHGTESTAKEVLSEDPDNAAALILIALCQNAAGDHHTALDTSKQALSIDQENDFYWRIQGLIQENLNAYKNAESSYLRAIELNAEDPQNHELLADYYYRRSKYKKAESCYERSIALDSDNPSALASYGRLLLDMGEKERAFDLIDRASEIAPDMPIVILQLGEQAYVNGDYQEAKDRALWALQYDAEDREAIALLCKIRSRRNPLMRLWLGWAQFLNRFDGKTQFVILIGLYFAFQVVSRTVLRAAPDHVQSVVIWSWVAFCLLTWIAPYMMARMIQKELKTVQMNDDF